MTFSSRRLLSMALLVVVLAALLPTVAPQAHAAGPVVFQEQDGRVVIEAEHVSAQQPGRGWADDHQWQETRAVPSATNGTALAITPQRGVNMLTRTDGPRLDYRVRFARAGTYHVFIRGYAPSEPHRGSNDSILVGLNGDCVSCRDKGLSGFQSESKASWQHQAGGRDVTITVPRAGEHVFHVWMREDGFVLDRIWLDQRGDAVRSDDRSDGPPESATVGSTGDAAAPAPPAPTGSTLTFRPERSSWSTLVNPMAGLYRWMGNRDEPIPLPELAMERYRRIEWIDLEPRKDQYDFGDIDAMLRDAERDHRRIAFRVRAVVSDNGRAMPEYLDSLMTKDCWERGTRVPDWNDPDFLDRAERLIAKLGDRYDGDPRLAWVDIGLYGNWGEWHMYGFDCGPDITAASKRRIVDMHRRAFTKTRLVMPSDDAETLIYALQQSSRIGWRRDSLSDDHFDSVVAKVKKAGGESGWTLVRDRWKTAPIITEFINPSQQSDPARYYERAVRQTRDYHITMNGNGNIPSYSGLSGTAKDNLNRLHRTLGYRLGIEQVDLPTTLQAGTEIPIAVRWRNDGVAPVYEPWAIELQLRRAGSSTVVWRDDLDTMDLRTVLPDAPRTLTGRAWLNSGLDEGTYDLTIQVRDPHDYLAPMELANRGEQRDGSYQLGRVKIRAAQRRGAVDGNAETVYQLESITTVQLPLLER